MPALQGATQFSILAQLRDIIRALQSAPVTAFLKLTAVSSLLQHAVETESQLAMSRGDGGALLALLKIDSSHYCYLNAATKQDILSVFERWTSGENALYAQEFAREVLTPDSKIASFFQDNIGQSEAMAFFQHVNSCYKRAVDSANRIVLASGSFCATP